MPAPLRRNFAHLLCLSSLLLASGCASMAGLQDCHFSCTNKVRAHSAWVNCYSRQERCRLGNDFEYGFKRGYYDTAMGKDCRLPPVAPPKYWSAKYQTCKHRKDIDNWFAGYQTGISVAQADGFGSIAEIPVAPGAPVLNRTGCGACYSPDRCNCRPYENGLIECTDFDSMNAWTQSNSACAVKEEPLQRQLNLQAVTSAEFCSQQSVPHQQLPTWGDSEYEDSLSGSAHGLIEFVDSPPANGITH